MSKSNLEKEAKEIHDDINKLIDTQFPHNLTDKKNELSSKIKENKHNSDSLFNLIPGNIASNSLNTVADCLVQFQKIVVDREEAMNNAVKIRDEAQRNCDGKRGLRRKYEKQIRDIRGCPTVFLRLFSGNDDENSTITLPFKGTVSSAVLKNLKIERFYSSI